MTRVVAFGAGAPRTDPAALDVRELGAKGAGLVRLASIGVAVPPGFVVSTGDVAAFLAGGAWPGAVRTAVDDALVELERRAGRPLGTAATALRVAVRGGAAQSMPGLLTTVLGVASPDAMWSAMDEVAASWTALDVVAFRRREGVPEAPPTAIVVQAMVDATADDRSGAGVATSRDPSTGAPGAWGEVVVRAPGAGLVGGTAQPLPLAHLATWLPDVQVELAAWLRSLERAWRDVVEVEFVVEAGRLWFVQVRPARRSAAAAVRIAVDLVADPDVAIDRADAVRRVDPAVVRALLDAVPAPAGGTVLATGVGASPGVGAERSCSTRRRPSLPRRRARRSCSCDATRPPPTSTPWWRRRGRHQPRRDGVARRWWRARWHPRRRRCRPRRARRLRRHGLGRAVGARRRGGGRRHRGPTAARRHRRRRRRHPRSSRP
ncbi:MAG: PEP/pyruvate-binding domain-containing protein [Acidimicrobiales bacterium]